MCRSCPGRSSPRRSPNRPASRCLADAEGDRLSAPRQGRGRRRGTGNAPGRRRRTTWPARSLRRRREALAAFGDGAVYLEREIRPARHIEVQLLGDAHWPRDRLGERDCSIQRRHQKLVEEAPAPGLVDRRAARAPHDGRPDRRRRPGCSNAATAEFLLDEAGRFWFLEVNARLQVEHGITELVSGHRPRPRAALAGGRRPLSAAALAAAERAGDPVGHAIEVRISLEDPARSFLPLSGRVGRLALAAGPGIRVDAGIEAGDRVPADYDPLVAKLMVYAADRPAAIERLRRALDETEIGGVQTTLPFHRFVATSPDFRAGRLSTDFVDEHWDGPASRAAAVRAGPRWPRGWRARPTPRPVARTPGRRTARRRGRLGWLSAARDEGVERWPG